MDPLPVERRKESAASRSMQVVVTTHSPDVLDAKWIEDRHLRILSGEHGRTRIGRVSQAVRTALREHLMGAGELLRSNALTAEDETDGNPGDPPRPEDGATRTGATPDGSGGQPYPSGATIR